MDSMATKIMWHVGHIRVDQNAKYGEDRTYNDETRVRSLFYSRILSVTLPAFTLTHPCNTILKSMGILGVDAIFINIMHQNNVIPQK